MRSVKTIDNLWVVVAAGGSSARYGGTDKLTVSLDGIPLFMHSVVNFLPLVAPGRLIVAVRADRLTAYRCLAERVVPDAAITWISGGDSRTCTVRNALAAISAGAGLVAVHDAARPLADGGLLRRLVKAATEVGGAVAAHAVTDSLKRVGRDLLIESPVDRDFLWAVETPQVFDLARLKSAYGQCAGENFTDDAEVMRRSGFPVAVVPSMIPNPKLTTVDQLELLEALAAVRRRSVSNAQMESLQ